MISNTIAKKLNGIEQAVLVSVLALNSEAYGIAVKKEAERRTGRKFHIGNVYIVLSRAEDHGLVESRLGEPTAKRGGRRKRFYTITDQGMLALQEAHRSVMKLWGGIESMI